MDAKLTRRGPAPLGSSEPVKSQGSPRGSRKLVAASLLPRSALALAVGCGVLFLLSFVASAARRGHFLGDAAPVLENGQLGFTPARNEHNLLLSSDSGSKAGRLLDGLLASGFEEQSCLSRYQSVLYRKRTVHQPSAYLVEKLRKHEALQRKCGPGSAYYNQAREQLQSGAAIESGECKYLLWIAYSGLGNRILTITSAFLYAVLTGRVLLVDRGVDMAELFCEPFPETSWFVPSDFPIQQFKNLSIQTAESYGNMVKNRVISADSTHFSSGQSPSYIYLHLDHDYSDHDKLFFCENDRSVLHKIQWLVLRSDNYFVPSLFLNPAFQDELAMLFPEKDAVFYHLGRYLFHPSNVVWGLITRYYDSYLAKANTRLGIQIRVFESDPGPFQHVFDQIIACVLKEKLLPEVDKQQPVVLSAPGSRSKAVLVTSLSSGYAEMLRELYWEHPTLDGEIIGVFQPSHEQHQRSEKKLHNAKAWAEMYLLSLTDVLVTSAWSTFGYVAQGLGGLRPWILLKPENRTVPDIPCVRVMSTEPCFHAPPFIDCKSKAGTDTGKLVAHVRHCEDMSWGLKLVNPAAPDAATTSN